MSLTMLRRGGCCAVLALVLALPSAHARSASARIARVTTGIATLDDVRVELAWPQGAASGRLRLRAARLTAADLGYRLRDVEWHCPLRRAAQGAWTCRGSVRAAGADAPFELEVDLSEARSDVALTRGASRIDVRRSAATPDRTEVDLTRVPLVWTQALLSNAWPSGRLGKGDGDARLVVDARRAAPLRVHGPVTLRGLALDTPDGAIAAENLGARFDLDMRFGAVDQVRVDGALLGGQLLFAKTFVDLAQRRVPITLDAVQDAPGWRIAFDWRDGALLQARGIARVDERGGFDALEVDVDSSDLAPVRDAYLSGLLGAAGLGEATLSGRARGSVRVERGVLQRADLALVDAAIRDPNDRFAFDGLDGDVRFSRTAPVDSTLRWRGGLLYGVPFQATTLRMTSREGELALLDDATLPILGGQARFDGVRIRVPRADEGLQIGFGLALDALDVAQLSKALDWPAFGGTLSGRIPRARYADNRLEFDGGLTLQLFDGTVQVSALSMERPFGAAPTLSGDVVIDDLDLQALTGAFDFGGITGRLDGRIAALRLVDWQPVAFNASLRTDARAAKARRAKQRISQRAVQDLSSVGDASFVSSLQGRLIGFFDDFGYSRIGIDCVLLEQVCSMDGLRSAGNAFTIVEGRGIPRLTVVGFNRRVDWPTLLERLAAVGSGDVKPIVE